MTGIAKIRCIDMVKSFTTGNHTIMTTYAGTIDLGVVNRTGCNRRPHSGEFFMTGITDVRCVDMCRPFTTRSYTIVTGNTVVDETSVVHRSWNPLLGTVTDVTFIGGRNVGRSFTGGNYIIVTTGAHTQNFRMVHTTLRNRRPWRGCWRMAGFTYIGGINVIGTFSRSDHTIMTTETGTNNLSMIHRTIGYRRPWRGTRLMAGIAVIGSINVVWPLA